MTKLRHTTIVASACMAVGALAATFAIAAAHAESPVASAGTAAVPRSAPERPDGNAREFTISADQFAFSPVQIQVQKDDLVKITLNARDIAHSFTIDQYRIAKRAAAGQSVTFEFRADQVGTHRFYCNLSQDDRCRKMEGILVVR
jgi:heme/copper-type cytochrome/quinol oxidase subunit 2